MKNEKCQFCNKETLVKQSVYIGKDIQIILPRNPISNMHLIILTKRHVKNFIGLKSEELLEIQNLIRKITDTSNLSQKYAEHNIIINSGSSAGQHINHFHLHIFFRHPKEIFSPLDALSKKVDKKRYTEDEWQNLFRRIKNLLTSIPN